MNVGRYHPVFTTYKSYQVQPVNKILEFGSSFSKREDVYLPSIKLKDVDMGKKNLKDSLGDRMKTNYESVPNIKLTRRMPMIIRLDGKAFHTFTKKFDRPFDVELADMMVEVTKYLVENIQGCKLGFQQSDEISLLVTDYDTLKTDSWFDKKVLKMTSIAASMATMKFQQLLNDGWINKDKLITYDAMFDARVFTIPKEEVCNYFIWRQQDATRNSIQMLGQAHFSHNQLHKKSCSNIQDMLMEKHNINWNDVPTRFKRGSCCYYSAEEGCVIIDNEINIFTQDRDFIDQFVNIGLIDVE